MKKAPSHPLTDRTKPDAPWYHLNSRQFCRALLSPVTEGGPFQPTGASAGSEGMLAGEVRGRSFTGAYTSRALSSHPDKPTIPVIAFFDDCSLSYSIRPRLSIPFLGFSFIRKGSLVGPDDPSLLFYGPAKPVGIDLLALLRLEI